MKLMAEMPGRDGIAAINADVAGTSLSRAQLERSLLTFSTDYVEARALAEVGRRIAVPGEKTAL